MDISAVDGVQLGWGESLVWDDRRLGLWYVDCAARVLWWRGDDGEVREVPMPSMPTGVVPTTDDRLVVVLDDGLHVHDPASGRTELLAAYPAELGGRCNDACADPAGAIITGKLNIGPAEGAAWRWSPADGWSVLDRDISNTNGPNVGLIGGATTLVVGDTSADYYAYDYDPPTGAAGPRRTFGDVSGLDGHPDGATIDAEGLLWCALFDGGQLARFGPAGLDRTLPVPARNPTDVTFGGPQLDRLYVTTISADVLPGGGELDGRLLVIDGLGITGRAEPRARLGR